MLINRYLIRHVLTATLFVTVILTLIIWLTQSLRFLELIVNASAPANAFITLVVLSLPKFIEVILPIALMAAVLFIYNRMIMDNELVVMRACGISQQKLARPALTLAWVITVVLLLMGAWFSPAAHTKMQTLHKSIKAEYSTFLLREGVFNTVSDNLMVFIRERTSDGELRGIMIHDARDKDEEPATVTAKRGIVVALESGDPQVIVYDGVRQQFDRESKSLSRLNFQQYTIEITDLKSTVPVRWREPDERNLLELFQSPKTLRDKTYHKQFIAEAHKRIVSPFLAVSFALIAVISLLMGPFNRHGQSRRVLTAVVLVTIVEGALLGVSNLAASNNLYIPLMYIIVFLPIVIGYTLLSKRGERLMQMSMFYAVRNLFFNKSAEAA